MGNLLKSDVSIQAKLLMFGFCSDLPSLRQGSGVQGAHRKHLWVCRQKRWCISSITINVSTAYNFLTVFFITSFCGYGCHDPCLSPLFKKDLPNRASISTGICQQPWAVGYVFVLASSVLLVILCLNHNVISNINIYITYIYNLWKEEIMIWRSQIPFLPMLMIPKQFQKGSLCWLQK